MYVICARESVSDGGRKRWKTIKIIVLNMVFFPRSPISNGFLNIFEKSENGKNCFFKKIVNKKIKLWENIFFHKKKFKKKKVANIFLKTFLTIPKWYKLFFIKMLKKKKIMYKYNWKKTTFWTKWGVTRPCSSNSSTVMPLWV